MNNIFKGKYHDMKEIVDVLDLYNPDKSKRKALPGDMYTVGDDIYVWDGEHLFELRTNDDINKELMLKEIAYELYKQNTPETLLMDFDEMLKEELQHWIYKAEDILSIVMTYGRIEYYEFINIDDIIND